MDNLEKKNIAVRSTCVVCNRDDETALHLFISVLV